jgi:hypothetical protein
MPAEILTASHAASARHLPIRCTKPGALPSSPCPRQDHRTRPNTSSQPDQIQYAAQHPPQSIILTTLHQPPNRSIPASLTHDSGYDSFFFNTSINGRQDSVNDDSEMAADYLNKIRFQQFIDKTPTTSSPSICPPSSHPHGLPQHESHQL